MKIGRIESKALSFCLMVAILATYSMVALAGEARVAGEIVVSGTAVDGIAPVVLVNGEQAKSGRSIFTSSSIVTDKFSYATVKVGSLGTVRIAPETSLTISFDENGVSAALVSGTVSVLSAENAVSVALPDGTVSNLTAGKSASTVQDDDDDDDAGAGAWVLWALVFGGATAAIIFAVASDNNRVSLGGNGAVISPSV
ncbi:MAG: hypothetical protein DWQ47_05655 [Acidobacteria bacterium]|nr:MAG: hypothetical protein DWQ32_09205 [Acidobacteriota bacterium]REK01865.1 MAG: hypothetical protein DWQ38_05640 [Acidobacteriota bacterium]REK14821.1 MAG: hypothetical protein DWQ43_14895 [Acidobacteriota bacterium]REK45536.1 MAG: hypothetical protein DWQ47_05655 [Acidobacteriota bacterium]